MSVVQYCAENFIHSVSIARGEFTHNRKIRLIAILGVCQVLGLLCKKSMSGLCDQRSWDAVINFLEWHLENPRVQEKALMCLNKLDYCFGALIPVGGTHSLAIVKNSLVKQFHLWEKIYEMAATEQILQSLQFLMTNFLTCIDKEECMSTFYCANSRSTLTTFLVHVSVFFFSHGITCDELFSLLTQIDKGLTAKILPHVIHHWDTIEYEPSSVELLMRIMKFATEPMWEFFFRAHVLEEKIIPFLAKVKDLEPELEPELWVLFLFIAKTNMGRMKLSEYISKYVVPTS